MVGRFLAVLIFGLVAAGCANAQYASPTYQNLTVLGATATTGPSLLNGKVTTAPSTTTNAPFNIPQGTAPTTPVNGDIWSTSASLYVRIGGVTVPLGGSGGSGCTVTGGTPALLVYNDGAGGCGSDTFASVLNGALTLGASGTIGSATFGNATSGLLKLQPQAGALGSVTVLIPAVNDTLTANAAAQTLTNKTITSPALSGTVTGNGTVPNAVLVNSSVTVNGQSCVLGSTCTVVIAASALSGTTLASGVIHSSLVDAAVGTLASAATAATGLSGHVLPYLDTAIVFSGASQTFPNTGLRVLGSSTGYNNLSSLNAGATNYIDYLPAASGNLAYLPTGSSVVSGNCAVWFGTAGALSDGGACGNITFQDGLGNTKSGISNMTLLGGVLSGTSPNATFTPQTTARVATANGTGGTGATIQTGDIGNVVINNNSGLTSVISALSSSYLQAGQSVTICNQFAATLSGTSVAPIIGYPTGGSAGAYTFTIGAPQNSTMTCLGLLSDGTSLYAIISTPPSMLLATVADQTVTGGFIRTPLDLGTVTSGTTTVDCGARDTQKMVRNGAFTLAMGANLGKCVLHVTNGASAGAITASGFTVGSNTGDFTLATLPTTNAAEFDIDLTNISGSKRYFTYAYQSSSSTFALVGTPVFWTANQTGTSGAYATTGARVIVVAITWNFNANSVNPVLTDSLSNTWTAGTAYYNAGSGAKTQLYYCLACSVGGAHTFTLTSSAATVFNAQVEAFSSPSASVDGATTGTTSGNAPTVNPGSITPAGAGDLFVTVVGSTDTGAALSVGGSFTAAPTTVAAPGGGYVGIGMAYFVNSGSSAQNPTWTITAGTNAAVASQIAFKP